MTKKRKPKAEVDAKFAREFHSETRLDWIASLPCTACGGGPCENHHISTGGMSKRAHYSLIIPLCFTHHREWHTIGRDSFAAKYGINPAVEAERIAKAWYEYDLGQPFHAAPE